MGERSNQLNTNTYKQYDEHSDENIEQLETEIEQTRAEMSETINAIQDRLSPEHLAEQARDVVYDATVGRAKGFGSNMLDTIKENPLPAAIAALSLGWLVRKNSEPRYVDYEYDYDRYPNYSSDYYNTGYAAEPSKLRDRVSTEAHDLRSNISQGAENLRDQAADTIDNVRNQAQEMGQDIRQQAVYYTDQAQERLGEAGEWVEETYYENPMVTGAVALALGAAVGMMLPTARVERKVMGPTRDRIVEQVKHTAQETLDKVENVAEEATKSVKRTVQQEAKEQGLT